MYVILIISAVLVAVFFFWASYSIGSGIYLRAYCRAPERGKRSVAITFDDGPDPVRTPALLDVLERHDVKASFFIIGERAAEHPEIVRRIADEGHTVGNHSWSHKPVFPLMSAGRIERELEKCDTILEETTGVRPAFFRPPFGVTDPPVAKAVKRRGYKVIGWDVRSLDTSGRSRNKVLKRMLRKTRGGSVILLHDPLPQSDELAERLIIALRERGYDIEPLEELLGV